MQRLEDRLVLAGTDAFSSATNVGALPYTDSGSNVGYTAESGEPSFSAPANSAWYKFTPSSTRNYQIDTIGSSFDTYLAVYSGSAVNSLTTRGENDDSVGTASKVVLNLSAGTTYHIQVDGFNNAVGSYILNVLRTPAAISSVGPVSPDPRTTAVDTVDVGFSESINPSTVSYQDFTLTRNGGSNLITSAVTVTQINSTTFRVGNLSGLTSADGAYSLTAIGSGIQTAFGDAVSGALADSWQKDSLPGAPTVVSTSPTNGELLTSGFSSMSVTFSERVTPATAQNVANYLLTGPSGAIPLTGAALDGSGTVVTLSFAAQTGGGSYSLGVGGISDVAGLVSPRLYSYRAADLYTSPTGSEGLGLTTGDFNGDGRIDVIGSMSGPLMFWPGQAGGTLGSPTPISSTATGFTNTLKAADLNGDGKLDLIVADASAGVSVFYGNGNGTFGSRQTRSLPGGGYSYNLVVTDIDGDGDLDIVSGADASSYVSTYINTGGQFADWTTPYASGVGGDSYNVFVADLNGDGRKDVVAIPYSTFATFALGATTAPPGQFVGSRGNFSTGYNTEHAALADVDGDGRMDLISGGSTNGDGGAITYGTSTSPYFGAVQHLSMAPGIHATNVQVADLDGDGDLDVIRATWGNRTVEIARNQGSRTFAYETVALPSSLSGYTFDLQTADLNGDGSPDIIGTDYNSRAVYVLRSQLAAPVSTFTLAPATMDSFQVQRGAVQRSFIRYVDASISDPSVASALAGSLADDDPTNDRVRLLRFELDGSGTGQSVSLAHKAQAVDHLFSLDFGSGGLTGNPLSTLGNGYYELDFDLDGDGVFETAKHFYRLAGDVNGDHTVDGLDQAAVNAAFGYPETNQDEDINGDTVVNILDRAVVARGKGQSLAGNLDLDA